MTIEFSPLTRALAGLEKSLGFLDSELARDPDLREQFRAAAIQGFEFTHELAFKMLKRQLEVMSTAGAAVDQLSYMEGVRAAAEAGLLRETHPFRDYREKRNITSHTYDAEQAESIVAVLPAFAADIHALLAELARRNPERA